MHAAGPGPGGAGPGGIRTARRPVPPVSLGARI